MLQQSLCLQGFRVQIPARDTRESSAMLRLLKHPV